MIMIYVNILAFFLVIGLIVGLIIWYDNKKSQATFDIITDGFLNHTIATKDDLKQIYEVKEISDTFADFLDHYIVSLREKKDMRVLYGDKEYSDKKECVDKKVSFNYINEFVTKVIIEERKEKPYEGVYPFERKLLIDIDMAARNEELSSVKSGLENLSNAIIDNQKKYEKAHKINKWSVPISVITVILSIVLFLVQQKSALTKTDIEDIMDEYVMSDSRSDF